MIKKLKIGLTLILLHFMSPIQAGFNVVNINNENIIQKIIVSKTGKSLTMLVVTEKEQMPGIRHKVYFLEIENGMLKSKKQILSKAVIPEEEYFVNKLLKLSNNQILMVSNTFITGNNTFIGRIYSEKGDLLQAKVIGDHVNYQTNVIKADSAGGFHFANFIDSASEHHFYHYDKDLNLSNKTVVNFPANTSSDGLFDIEFRDRYAYVYFIGFASNQAELDTTPQLGLIKIDLNKKSIEKVAILKESVQIKFIQQIRTNKGLEVICLAYPKFDDPTSSKMAKVTFDLNSMQITMQQSNYNVYDLLLSKHKITDPNFGKSVVSLSAKKNNNTYTIQLQLTTERSVVKAGKNKSGKIEKKLLLEHMIYQCLVVEMDEDLNLKDSGFLVGNELKSTDENSQFWSVESNSISINSFKSIDKNRFINFYITLTTKISIALNYQVFENGTLKPKIVHQPTINPDSNNYYTLLSIEAIGPDEFLCEMITKHKSQLLFITVD